jgi:glycosyltransferase involved in cell wall biosynthesis
MSVPTPDQLHAAFRLLEPYGELDPSPAEDVEPPASPPADTTEAAPLELATGWRGRVQRQLRQLRGTSPSANRAGIHQFVPTLLAGDAVGRHTLRLRDSIAARGIPSRIYVQGTDPRTASETEEFTAYPERAKPGDVLVYQFATASDLAAWLSARPETLVVNYHNVTPPELFAPWDPPVARIQQRAQRELQLMASRTALAIADSSFNLVDLAAAGYAETAVVPPIAAIDLVGSAAVPDRALPQGRGARWLCVGRLAPNKAFEDALKALVVTRDRHDPAATLDIVGNPVQPAYSQALRRFASDLGLNEAVTFHGHVGDDELRERFNRADILVVPSVHEGFCVPLVEAMSIGLPVVASQSGVSLDVLGSAGVMVDTHDPEMLAGTIADLLSDAGRYAALVAAGREQLQVLDLARAGTRIVDLLVSLSA